MRKKYIPNKISRKTSQPPSIQKSCDTTTDTWEQLLGYGFGDKYGFTRLTNRVAWNYYNSVSVVQNCTDLIMENFAMSIKPCLLDTQTGEYIKEYKSGIRETGILQLLATPSDDKNATDFKEAGGKCYDVTGNMYTQLKAISEDSEPIDICNINPACVNPIECSSGGVGSYIVTDNGTQTTYYKDSTGDKTRYLTKDGRWELDHMKRFSSSVSSGGSEPINGQSSYSSLFYELEQLMSAGKHNWATLTNGGNPSMAVSIDKEITISPTQLKQIKKELNASYQGVENAGNVMVLHGGTSATPFTTSNKDLDFANMIGINKEQVYRNKKIPQSLVNESAKYSNLQESKAQLFELCVFPFATRYYEELNALLMPRYDKKSTGRYRITFDMSEVPAMEYIEIEKAKLSMETGLLTTNEGRAMMGLEEIDGGDVLIVKSGSNTLSNIVAGQINNSVAEAKSMTKESFMKSMKSLKDQDGNRKYSDAYIIEKSNELEFCNG